MIFLFYLVVCFNCAVTKDVIYGKAINWDWDERYDKIPPVKENVHIDETSYLGRKEITFKAFGKHWRFSLQPNTVLLARDITFEYRTVLGRLVRQDKAPQGCFYIGTVDAGPNEAGWVSMTTCNGRMRALAITNLNDYVILPSAWNSGSDRRRRRSSGDYVIQVSPKSHNDPIFKQMKDILHKQNKHSSSKARRRARRDIKMNIMPQPNGRVLHVELGLIVDGTYMDDFKGNISKRRADLHVHILEVVNNAQLWYIHPSLGYQIWFTVRNVVYVEEILPAHMNNRSTSHISAVCKWQHMVLPNSKNWDEIVIFSSNLTLWDERIGLSLRSGACTNNHGCAGVSPVKFQMATLGRLFAHEAGHPLGMPDDYQGDTSKLCYTGMMRRGVYEDHDWAICSVQEFEQWVGIRATKCILRNKTPSLAPETKPPLIAVNVAWRANVEQISTYESEAKWGAWKATDGSPAGVPNGNATVGSCTHTLVTDRPWIRVDLGSTYSKTIIDTIHVYNRDDCCGERLKNFEVRVGDNKDILRNVVCNFYKGAVPGGRYGMAVIKCKRPLKGRYVSIQIIERNRILTVCEIMVFQEIHLKNHSPIRRSCEDLSVYCSHDASVGDCDNPRERESMRYWCPYSCGICTRTNEVKPWASSKKLSPTYRPVLTPGCVDSHSICRHVLANKGCETKPRYYGSMCKRSCGKCGSTLRIVKSQEVNGIVSSQVNKIMTSQEVNSVVTGDCTDSDTNCASWKEAGYCKSNTHTRTTCRKTCNSCQIHNPKFLLEVKKKSNQNNAVLTHCKDTSISCKSWVKAGYCKTSWYVKQRCAKGCNVCQTKAVVSSDCTDANFNCKAWAEGGYCRKQFVTKNCKVSCKLC